MTHSLGPFWAWDHAKANWTPLNPSKPSSADAKIFEINYLIVLSFWPHCLQRAKLGTDRRSFHIGGNGCAYHLGTLETTY